MDFGSHVKKAIKPFGKDATGMDFSDHVGPALQVGVAAEAGIAAIGELYDGVKLGQRDSYASVLFAERCIVTRYAIEARSSRGG